MFDQNISSNYTYKQRVNNTAIILEKDRTEEFRELVSTLAVSQSSKNWKERIA